MAKSGAKVNVYRGNSSTPIKTFTIDPSSEGLYWHVFDLDISNGIRSILKVDEYYYAPDQNEFNYD